MSVKWFCPPHHPAANMPCLKVGHCLGASLPLPPVQTTFMDCLAGRKTAGRITGDVRVNGHPQVFSTFARISGYCEQVRPLCASRFFP